MMSDIEDNFEWARRLECPASARTNSIKKSLNSGITSLLWDELGSVVHPCKEVLDVRKNILLYKLKHGEKDLSIQHVRNSQQLRAARSRLDPQIEILQEECEQKDFLARQKHQQLSKVRVLRKSIKTKEDLLRMKFNQMQTQVDDCKEMRLVCQHLMPATSRKIDPQIVNESLSLVGAISTKADKKIAWNKISETLSPVEISTLWNILLSRRTQDTNELIALETREIADNDSKSGENIDIGIARVCGQYITTAAQRLIHHARANQHEKLVMEYIEKIEASEMNSVDVSEWLALTLEVRKLETEKSILQSEVDSLKKTLEHKHELDDELSNLESDIHSIDTKVERCVQDIQKSLTLLKSAGLGIAQTKEKLLAVLQKVASLHSENQSVNYLNIDLGTELNIFHDTVQLEALRKIVLKDAVGAYRHTKCCISEAQRSITVSSQSNSTSQFPMIRAPIYELLNCYKNLVATSWLAKLENELVTNERNDVDELAYPLPIDCSNDAIEILNATDLTCDRVRQELRLFDLIFDAWNNQTVQKAMALDDRIVKGATFKEWVKRYNTLLYMVRRTK